MKKITIAVVFGGCSTEYDVSLHSAAAVIDNLDRDKYDVLTLGITREGNWRRYAGPLGKIADGTWCLDRENCGDVLIAPDRTDPHLIEYRGGEVTRLDIDAVFPVLHGKYGEDGTLQGLFELIGLPVVGCGTLSSALCMDKDRAHRLVALEGIQTPISVCFDAMPSPARLKCVAGRFTFPVFVKPVRSGSSFGITKVDDPELLQEAVENAFRYDGTVLIEEAIPGFEVGCAVLGNRETLVGEVDEIELQQGFFNYDEKYTLKTSKIHMPARIDGATKDRLRQAAVKIYRALGCTGFARVDMFLTPTGEIVFNEVNTIPGFTSHSRYPSMMKGIGLTFPELLDKLIELGLEA
jgi:D-alanine---D-serine ligase